MNWIPCCYRKLFVRVAIVLIVTTAPTFVRSAEPQAAIRVTLPQAFSDQPLNGRLYVFVSQSGGEPRFGPNWFQPEPFFAKDVLFKPGAQHVIDDTADHFPDRLSKLPPGKYRIQALFDHEFYSASPAHGVGNFYSDVVELEVKENSVSSELTLQHTVKATAIPQREWLHVVDYRSELLSDFFQRDVEDRAVVVLPRSYLQYPKRRYPVLFIVSGFGGTSANMAAGFVNQAPEVPNDEIDAIRVLLSGECKWGHHVYADSATNGPRGKVLTEELIPLIDRKFRTVASPNARFLSGHSSGGWSSLWLQITYPDHFGGTWSTSPDPVDFRDYQASDLYAVPPVSIYFDEQGAKKPIARQGRTPVLWYPDFGKMDDCLGRGGQLRSFEAVFSPLGSDGLPLKMWDRRDGRVDPKVAQAWARYDISRTLRESWPTLGPRLQGKIHVLMGELDTFYLEGATRLLKQVLEELGSDAQVTMVEGADHGSVLNRNVLAGHRREMRDRYLQYFDLDGNSLLARP